MQANFILFVSDQEKSKEFYQSLLSIEPSLHVPGMTEFQISERTVLGLIPEKGIKRILGDSISDPEKNNGESRCEVYLTVDNPEDYFSRAVELGAKVLSPIEKRNWGDFAGYIKDLDGHVVVFAKKVPVIDYFLPC